MEEAKRHDMKLTPATLGGIPVPRPDPGKWRRQHLCSDRGYDFPEIRKLAEAFGHTTHIRRRREDSQAIKRDVQYEARRWVAERTHSWMNRFRRISIRWEKKLENYLGLLHLVCGVIAFRQADVLG